MPDSKKKPAPLKSLDPDFAKVVKAFAEHPHTTPPHEGRSFGFRGIKVRGKIFAMMSSKGHFVAKLPPERVAALVQARKGVFFDPGHGRLMKGWVAMKGNRALWLRLAREAHAYVPTAPSTRRR